jgi:RimJ/RimL family protein N-acetyltransferase
MKLVDCTQEYWEFVRILRTNYDNSVWFYTQPDISVEQQINYMSDNSYKYKICLYNNNPVGYIGILGKNEITYCVEPNYKNLGIGTFMVSEFMKKYDELTAFVIPENISSNRVFEKLGFEKQIFFKYKKK